MGPPDNYEAEPGEEDSPEMVHLSSGEALANANTTRIDKEQLKRSLYA